LASLPSWIGELATLRRLDLESNGLTALPPEMAALTKLEWLRLERNNLSDGEKARIKKALPGCFIAF